MRWVRRSPAAGVLLAAAAVFLAGLFLDTAGVIELSWLCLRGQCGVPARYVLAGFGLLLAGGVLLLRPVPSRAARRRAGTPGTPVKRPARPAAAKQPTPALTTAPVGKRVDKPAVKTAVNKSVVKPTAAARPPGRTPASRGVARRPASGQRRR